MTITRRSLLHGLGALSATACASHPLSALEATLAGQAALPDPDSIYLIFEGPWLIFPDPTDPASLNAVSLGLQGGAIGPDSHIGMVGTSEPVCGTLANPQTVAAGQQWNVAVASHAAPPSFTALFSQPTDPFVWITGGLKVKALAMDRLVKFPMPNRFYVGGQLTGTTITDSGNYLKNKSAHPYVASIFQYTPAGSTAPSLTYGAGNSTTIGPGSHLVFRMTHRVGADSMSDEDHVKSAFTELVSRIGGTSRPPVAMSAITSVNTVLGSNTGGFLGPELGFETGAGCATMEMAPAKAKSPGPANEKMFPPIPPSFSFFTKDLANCQGGGGVVGPYTNP